MLIFLLVLLFLFFLLFLELLNLFEEFVVLFILFVLKDLICWLLRILFVVFSWNWLIFVLGLGGICFINFNFSFLLMFLGGDFWLFLLFVVFIFFLIFLFEIFFFFDFEGKVKRLKICLKYFKNKFILFIKNFIFYIIERVYKCNCIVYFKLYIRLI